MKLLKCELCGSTDLNKIDDYFICQNCRAKYIEDYKMAGYHYSSEDTRKFIDSLIDVQREIEFGNDLLEKRKAAQYQLENIHKWKDHKYFEEVFLEDAQEGIEERFDDDYNVIDEKDVYYHPMLGYDRYAEIVNGKLSYTKALKYLLSDAKKILSSEAI